MMGKLTKREREHFATLAKEVAAPGNERQAAEDILAALVIKTLREQFKDADDATLARIAGMVALVTHHFATLNICDLHVALENMYVTYGLAGAALAGVHEIGAKPEDIPDVPDEDEPAFFGQYL